MRKSLTEKHFQLAEPAVGRENYALMLILRFAKLTVTKNANAIVPGVGACGDFFTTRAAQSARECGPRDGIASFSS
jgi:hypothetical protein